MKLKELKSIIESNITYLWVDNDCFQIKDKNDMYSNYGEREVKCIYDDADGLNIELYTNR